VFALDKKTGALNWTNETGGIPVDAPYSTPSIGVINGERIVVVVAGDGGVHAFQTRTGKQVWTYILSKRGLNASPLIDGNFVYACSSEENVDSPQMGRVVCLDASQIENGAPKEVWRIDGIEAGFASPTFFDGRLYVFDNGATVHAIDARTGKVIWKRRAGTIGKASPVYGDGKLYVGEANGRFHIWELGPKSAKPLTMHYLGDKMGREYAIYGSVAISNGRVYLQAANSMYCIGPKEAKKVDVPVPGLPPEAPVEEDSKVAVIQVRPADALLRAGEKVDFTALAFNAKGRSLGEAKDVKWSVGQLVAPVPHRQPPPPKPVMIGNLEGNVDQSGTFTTASAQQHQGGGVYAASGDIRGLGRVRLLPPLPWKFDFEQNRIGSPPLTWLGAGGKFAVEEKAGSKVLTKLLNLDLYYRARTNFGLVDMSNYTLAADVNVGEKVVVGERKMPDPGLINSRYVLILLGDHQRLQIHTWPSALPHSLNKTIPFQWSPNTWYRMKLRVEQEPGKAVVRGKVWKRDETEPEAWTIQLEDTLPNTHGNPGLFGHSQVTPYKSEIYYDNIEVIENK
jgi:outer membrane protein assembly factor BamB